MTPTRHLAAQNGLAAASWSDRHSAERPLRSARAGGPESENDITVTQVNGLTELITKHPIPFATFRGGGLTARFRAEQIGEGP
jgi:hypothetical protein